MVQKMFSDLQKNIDELDTETLDRMTVVHLKDIKLQIEELLDKDGED